MKRGFTLIETIAVIIILAVVALVAVPIINTQIEDTKMKSFSLTCDEIYGSFDKYFSLTELDKYQNKCIVFDFAKGNENVIENGDIVYEPISKLNISGHLPSAGIYSVCGETVTLKVDNGSYTCNYTNDSKTVLKGNIYTNDLTPSVINNITYIANSNSLTIVVDAIDEDGEIAKYYYKIGDNDYIESNKSSYKFENLESDTTYNISVYVINGSNLQSEIKEIEVATKNIKNTSYSIAKYPIDTEYSQYKDISVAFDENSNLYKYIKTTVNTTSEVNVIGVCGTSSLPGNCTNISTKNFEKNKWYLVDSNISVNFKENGILYTYLTDKTNSTNVSTLSVNNIDTIIPTCSLYVNNNYVEFNELNDENIATYGISKTNKPLYDNSEKLILGEGIYYGYVKDKADNINTCRLTVSKTYVSSYIKSSKACIEKSQETYKFADTIYQITDTCTANNIACTKDNVGKTNVSCSTDHAVYKKVESKCIGSNTPSYEFENGTTLDNQTSCTSSAFECNESNVGKSYNECTKKYTVTTKTCKKSGSKYAFTNESTKTGQTSCTEDNFTCDKNHKNKTATICVETYKVTPKTCASKVSTTYSFDTPKTTNGAIICTENNITCNAQNVNKSKITCTKEKDMYKKEMKECVIGSTPIYDFDNNVEAKTNSCTVSTIECNKDNVGQVNVSCHNDAYSCLDSSATQINNEYCYKVG